MKRSRPIWEVTAITIMQVALSAGFAQSSLRSAKEVRPQMMSNASRMRQFEGTWIRLVHKRTFLVLRLSEASGRIVGTLSRPLHFNEVSGEESTVVDPDVITVKVMNGRIVQGGTLEFETEDPTSALKSVHHTLRLWDENHASLNYENWQGMPYWSLVRARGESPSTVAHSWPREGPAVVSSAVAALQKKLRLMVQQDQQADTPPFTHFKEVCERNYPALLRIFAEYGWLKVSEVGRDTASDFWLLVVHQCDTHLDFTNKALVAMKRAVDDDEASFSKYALLSDSIAYAEGRPQKWGTKTVCKEGRRALYTVADPAGLEHRRDEAGLPPLAYYLASFPPCSG